MDIRIWSRIKMLNLINKFPDDVNYVNIISIHGVFETSLFMFKTKKILPIKFDDITKEDLNYFSLHERDKYTLFNEKHAEEIIKFLNEMDKHNQLIINCHAGQCRSSAVAVYTQAKFGTLEETWKLFCDNIINPNEHVLDTLNKTDPLPENIFKEIKGFLNKNPYLLTNL